MLGGFLVSNSSLAAPLQPGNLAVYRVGAGDTALVTSGSAVFIDEYTPAGALVQSIAMPTVASGATRAFVANGIEVSEGLLTLSGDGRYLVSTGYARDLIAGGTPLNNTFANLVPRVIGRVALDGTVNTTTALGDFASVNTPRSAYSSNGTDFWVAGGSGGVRFTTLGSTTSSSVSGTLNSLRQLNAFSGQLMASSGGAVQVGNVGTGLPTSSGQTLASLPGLMGSGSAYAFFLADLTSTVPGNDTLYVADDVVQQILKFSLVAGQWTPSGSIGVNNVRGLTGYTFGSSVQLFATTGAGTGAGGGAIYSALDITGYNSAAGSSATTLFTLPNNSNKAFRGIAYIVPEPSGLVLVMVATLVGVRRRRRD